MMKSFHRIACGFAIGFSATGAAWAQAPQPEVKTEQPAQTERRTEAGRETALGVATPQETDARIAAWLEIGNLGEAELSKIAQTKATTEAVRQFAAMLATDHQKCLEELTPFRNGRNAGAQANRGRNRGNSANGSGNGQATTEQPTTPQAGAQAPRTEGAAPGGTTTTIRGYNGVTDPAVADDASGTTTRGSGVDFLRVKREVCQRCIAVKKEAFEKMNAQEFEKAFVGSQVFNHEEMLATLETLRPYASARLQPVLDRGIETTRTHLEKAKSLCEQVREQQPATRSAN